MQIIDSIVEYFINLLAIKKVIYFYLAIVILRYTLFFFRRGLKENLFGAFLTFIVMVSFWELWLREYIGKPWIFHTLAIISTFLFVTVSFKRTYLDKDEKEKKEFIRSFTFVSLELTIIFIIIFMISIETGIFSVF